jgi:hypothetical protein
VRESESTCVVFFPNQDGTKRLVARFAQRGKHLSRRVEKRRRSFV